MNKTDYVTQVCKIGLGNKCCRYLMAGRNGFECALITSPGLVKKLDRRAEAKSMVAIAKNCNGKDLINYDTKNN